MTDAKPADDAKGETAGENNACGADGGATKITLTSPGGLIMRKPERFANMALIKDEIDPTTLTTHFGRNPYLGPVPVAITASCRWLHPSDDLASVTAGKLARRRPDEEIGPDAERWDGDFVKFANSDVYHRWRSHCLMDNPRKSELDEKEVHCSDGELKQTDRDKNVNCNVEFLPCPIIAESKDENVEGSGGGNGDKMNVSQKDAEAGHAEKGSDSRFEADDDDSEGEQFLRLYFKNIRLVNNRPPRRERKQHNRENSEYDAGTRFLVPGSVTEANDGRSDSKLGSVRDNCK
jgi:hypothetical protein